MPLFNYNCISTGSRHLRELWASKRQKLHSWNTVQISTKLHISIETSPGCWRGGAMCNRPEGSSQGRSRGGRGSLPRPRFSRSLNYVVRSITAISKDTACATSLWHLPHRGTSMPAVSAWDTAPTVVREPQRTSAPCPHTGEARAWEKVERGELWTRISFKLHGLSF